MSYDGAHLCTVGEDKSAKVFDVLSFDMMARAPMCHLEKSCSLLGCPFALRPPRLTRLCWQGMIRLQFTPLCCEWIYTARTQRLPLPQPSPGAIAASVSQPGRQPSAAHGRTQTGDAVLKLAISDAAGPAVHIFDGRSGSGEPVFSLPPSLHAAPVRLMAFNAPMGAVISADAKGGLEYWRSDDYSLPSSVSFRFKVETDLFAHCAAKAMPLSLEISSDGSQFATWGSDRRVRVFRFRTGKLRCTLDESLDAANEAQRCGGEVRAACPGLGSARPAPVQRREPRKTRAATGVCAGEHRLWAAHGHRARD